MNCVFSFRVLRDMEGITAMSFQVLRHTEVDKFLEG
jgi:hypothetical protein